MTTTSDDYVIKRKPLVSPVVFWGFLIALIAHLAFLFLIVLPKQVKVEKPPEEKYDIVDLQKVPPPPPPPPPPKVPPPPPPKQQKQQPKKPQAPQKGSAVRKLFQTKSSTSSTVVAESKGGPDGDMAASSGTGAGNAVGAGSAPIGNPEPSPPAPPAPPAPPPEPPPPEPLVKARSLTPPNPVYPDSARSAGIEGVVVVRAYVNTSGTVTRTKVMRSSGNPDLDQAAQEAVAKMKFEPAHRGDTPVESKPDISVRFSLT